MIINEPGAVVDVDEGVGACDNVYRATAVSAPGTYPAPWLT